MKSDNEWVLVKRDGTTEIYGAKYFTLVRTENLKWLFDIAYDGYCGTGVETEKRIEKMRKRLGV